MAKQTIWQGLNAILHPYRPTAPADTVSFSPAQPAESPEDAYIRNLQRMQDQLLDKRHVKVTHQNHQQQMGYEGNRMVAYGDYDSMCYYPIISSAIDILSEESTTMGNNGQILTVYSSQERIRKELEHLFYDIIGINSVIFPWTRNLVKYGDNFVFMHSKPKQGIVQAIQQPVSEMERTETSVDGRTRILFKRNTVSEEYDTFQVAHFRLLWDDKYLPYGTSPLDKVRRTVRELVMMEDAMLIYRLERAPERRVFKVNVGNIDEKDVKSHMQRIAQEFKRTTQTNRNNGRIDHRYNPMHSSEDYFIPVRNDNASTVIDTLPGACLALDTEISLLDGRSLPLSDIINEHASGKQLWSYSIDTATGRVVPGKITWAGVTRRDAKVLRITLDNGNTITVTPDHKFPTRLNGIRQAKDLLVGEPLWGFTKPVAESTAGDTLGESGECFITGTEHVEDTQDTGTITIDGKHEFHDFHNFALTAGVFTQNSNLDAVGDLNYLRDNLFSGLGIPKPFLSFDAAAGEGKSLAMSDIRFAKKINRIQQAIIQELNKIAIIHLYLKGFTDDLSNFKLSLANPSLQGEILRTEVLSSKMDLYTKATAADNGGVAPMSHTRAKKEILGWTEQEIILDLERQKMERALVQELQDAPTVIKKTHVFDRIDRKYGNLAALPGEVAAADDATAGAEGGGPAGDAPAGDAPDAPADGGGGEAEGPGGGQAGGLPPMNESPAAKAHAWTEKTLAMAKEADDIV